MSVDGKLLREYSVNRSESAFAEIVGRYLNLVYAAALRQVQNEKTAEDVTQMVFANLARKAATIPSDAVLAGWLHRDTCFTCRDLLRKERRRVVREQMAMSQMADNNEGAHWPEIRPFVDQCMDRLKTSDRDALLLRYFEEMSVKEIALKMSLKEPAVEKRISRALDRLRSVLEKRGIRTSGEALAANLSSFAVGVAPASMGKSIASAAIASACAPKTSTLATWILMSKTKTLLFGASLAIALAAPTLVHQRMKAQIETLQSRIDQQATELDRLRAESDRLAQLTGDPRKGMTPNELSELLRMRNQIGQMRDELAGLKSTTARATKGTQDEAPAPLSPDAIPKEAYSNVGYTSPTNSMQTLLWAITRKDPQALLDSYSSKLRPMWENLLKDMPPGVMPGGFQNGEIYNASGFRVLKEVPVSNDEKIVKIFLEGRNTVASYFFENENGLWKCGPGATDDDIANAEAALASPSQ